VRNIFKYVSEMDLGSVIYTPSFIKTGSGIQELSEGNTHTPTAR
jgi:hypothetical protein